MTYQVVGLLGRGSMAVVELAVDDNGRRVARKRVALTGSAAEIDAARRRLRREAEILSRLQHPHIVQILAVTDDGEDVVLVMPALAGSLADRVRATGHLTPDEIGPIGAALLDGLAAAHRAGVVHRDIKPGNVLFTDDGRPALADFGVAVSRDLTAGLTARGSVVGTPAYMAPEQARGEQAGPASDVFALGATLLHAATGEPPYGYGAPGSVLGRAARGEPPRVPRWLPPELRRSLTAMLDPRPGCRPSAAALLGGVAGTWGLAGASPRRRAARAARRGARRLVIGPPDPAPSWSRRRQVTVAGGAVVAAALVGTLAVAAWPSGPSSRHGRAAPASCAPLRYEACGAAPAPNTDGAACLPGWFDLDQLAADGCEARSDYRPGQMLAAGATLAANLVPAGAVATYTTRVSGHAGSLCWGTLNVVLTAPAGTADRLEVWHGPDQVAQATSSDGQPATAKVHKPSCLGGDSETLTLRVRDVAGTSASDFTLARDGGW